MTKGELNLPRRNRSCLSYMRKLLFPFSLIYLIVVWFRNRAFDWGWKPSRQYDFPVISIGNITVGGTGKTPHAEYLIRLLQPLLPVTLISRGYRRKTKGVVIASKLSTSDDIGDEPKQILDKYPAIGVIVAEKRVEGIAVATTVNAHSQVIVLDDAYQHRHVKPGFSILLMDYNRPFWRDLLLPAGNLREPVSGKRRANVIIVSKCPVDLSPLEAEAIEKRIKPSATQHVFFTTFKYAPPVAFDGTAREFPSASNAMVLTGIASPEPFYQHLESIGMQVSPMAFPDHHHFSTEDIDRIEQRFLQLPGSNPSIITTEKDAIRLRDIMNLPTLMTQNLWVIPIEVVFLFNQQETFNHQIREYVSTN